MAKQQSDPVKSVVDRINDFFVSVLVIKRGTDQKVTIEGSTFQKRSSIYWILEPNKFGV